MSWLDWNLIENSRHGIAVSIHVTIMKKLLESGMTFLLLELDLKKLGVG